MRTADLSWAGVAMIIASLALLAPGAQAASSLGVADDGVFVYQRQNRSLALDRVKALGATHIRVMIKHRSGQSNGTSDRTVNSLDVPIQQYEDALRAITSAGLTPQVTLSWNGEDDPGEIAAWSGAMTLRLGAYVTLWSVLSEPDLNLRVTSRECNESAVRALVKSGQIKTIVKVVRVKKYRRTRVTIVRNGKRLRVWKRLYWIKKIKVLHKGKVRVVKVKRRRYKWVKRKRTFAVTLGGTNGLLTLQEACQSIVRGRKYQPIFASSAAAIHIADPGSQVWAGETSAHLGLDLFVGAAGRLNADCWAHHPYEWAAWGASRVGTLSSLAGMPVCVTEFGYPRPGTVFAWLKYQWSWSTEQELLGIDWSVRQFVQAGVRYMVWYQLYPGPVGQWDTALLHDETSLAPAYLQLRDTFSAIRAY